MAGYKPHADRNITLLVTHVKPEGQFLKFYALLDNNVRMWKEVEQALIQCSSELEKAPTLPWTNSNICEHICCVKVRRQWYRARVAKFDVTHVAVFLIDHGNFEVVPKCDVRCASKEIISLPIYTMECILADVAPLGEEWSLDVVQLCEQGLLQQNLSGYIVTYYGTIPVIRLAKLGESEPFVQRLINNNLARIEMFGMKQEVSQNSIKFKYVPLSEGETHLVNVSVVYSTKHFYVQLTAAEVELRNLMASIEIVVNQGKLSHPTTCNVGMPCLAVLNSHYYRAVIQDIQHSIFKVMLVDYGTTLTKSYEELFAIPAQFLTLPAQAVMCSLKDDHLITVENFKKIIGEHRNLSCQVVGNVGEIALVHLLLKDHNILAIPKTRQPSKFVTQPLEFITQPLVLNELLQVASSFVLDPQEFYCQITSCKQDIDIVASKLESAHNFEPLSISDIFPGLPLCAMFSEDNLWYRAKVLTVKGPIITVSFVDYGNVEEVQLQSVRSMPANLLTHSIHAYKFVLHDVEPVLPDDLVKWFVDITSEENLIVEVKAHIKDNHYSVILFQENQAESVNNKLNLMMAKPVPVVPEVSIIENLYVTVFNAPVFFGQFTKFDLDTLVGLQRKLNSDCQSAPIKCDKVNVGDYVCAKFSEDNHYYRAVVESVTSSGCKVFFVDYGNRCSVDLRDIQPLNPKFASHPMFGIECVVENLPEKVPQDELSSLLIENEVQIQPMKKLAPTKWQVLFTESFAGNLPVLKVISNHSRSNIPTDKIISSTGTMGRNSYAINRSDLPLLNGGCLDASASMKYEKLDISTGTFREIYVSYANNPSEFYCQLTSESSELQNMMKNIEDIYSKQQPNEMKLVSPEIGSPCCAVYEEDSMWYRAEIQSISGRQCQICFVDYGNKQIVELIKLKALHPKFCSLPSQAVQCTSFNITPDSGKWNASASSAFTTMVSGKSFVAQFVKVDEKGVFSINLFDFNKLQDGVLGKDFVQSGHGQLQDSSRLLVVNSLVASTSLMFIELDVPLETHNVNVTFVKNLLIFFCQLQSKFADFKSMMEKIQSCYKNQSDSEGVIDRPHVGMICIAQFLDDQAWYRAKIVSVDKNRIGVSYVDYGNEAFLPKNKVKYILQEFTVMPTQALKCQLHGLKNPKEKVPTNLPSLFEGKSTCTFIKKESEHYIVSLQVNGKDVSKEIAAQGCAILEATSDQPSGRKDQKMMLNIPSKVGTFQKDQLVGVIASHIESPMKFWCQLDETTELDELSDKMQIHYASVAPSVFDVDVGTYCVAKYSVDDSWYRALVQRIVDSSSFEVLFIDYGNSEVVLKSEIREMLPDHFSCPAQAVESRLYGLPLSYDVSLNETFRNLLENTAELTAKVEIVSADYLLVTLFAQSDAGVEVNVLEFVYGCQATTICTVLDDVQTSYLPPAIPSVATEAYVSHVNNPGSFYVTLSSLEETLKIFANKVTAHCNSNGKDLTVDRVAVGSSCCAKFSEDGEWYRATIANIDGDNITVQFVDYGNSDVVTKDMLRTAGKDLLATPAFAIPCFLADVVPPMESYEQTISDQFNDLVIDASLKVMFFNDTLPVAVCLIQDGKVLKAIQEPNLPMTFAFEDSSLLINRTLTICKNMSARVCFAESAQAVFINASEWISDLESIGEQLEEVYASSEEEPLDVVSIGQFYAAKFSDDCWYRAVVTAVDDNSICIRFIDYGNTTTVQRDKLRMLKPQFMEHQPFTVKCQLNIEPVVGQEKEILDRLDAIIDSAADVEVDVQTECETYTINIVTEDGDFTSLLLEAGLAVPISQQDQISQQVQNVQIQDDHIQDDQIQVDQIQDDKIQDDHIQETVEEITDTPSKKQDIEGLAYPERNLPKGKLTVTISHVESSSEFYITPVECCNDVENLAASLQEQYTDDSESVSADDVAIGYPCVAKYSEDGLWYRAIVSAVDEDSAFVKFVDHGNSEMTSFNNLKLLVKEFSIVPPFALRCCLFSLYPKEGAEDAISSKLQVFCDDFSELAIEVVEHSDSYAIKLYSDGDFLDHLMAEGLVDEVPREVTDTSAAVTELVSIDDNLLGGVTATTEPNLECQSKNNFSDRYFEIGTCKAQITFVENWNAFYVSAIKWSADFSELKEEMSNVYAGESDEWNVEDIQVGQTCAVYSPEHDEWCRGVVEEIGEIVGLQLVDYGTSLNMLMTDVKTLSPEFLDLPKFAVKCKLYDMLPIRGMELDVIDKLQNLCDDNVIFEMVAMDENIPCSIKIKTDSDFFSELVEEGLAITQFPSKFLESFPFKDNLQIAFLEDHVDKTTRLSIPSPMMGDEECVCTLQHCEILNGTISLYIVPKDLVSSLADFQKTLQTEYDNSTHVPWDVEEKDFCVAKFTKDNCWYRAQVLQKLDDTVLVKAIDCGWRDLVRLDDIRQPKLSVVPQYVVQCCLLDVFVIEGEEKNVEQLLMKYETEWKIRLCQMTSHSARNQNCIVEAKVSDCDIVDSLICDGLVKQVFPLPKDLKVFQCNVISIDEDLVMYIVPHEYAGKRDLVQNHWNSSCSDTEKLTVPNVTTTRLYAATKDSVWYRISVTSVNDTAVEGYLVDFGVTHTFDIADLRRLQPELCHLSPFCLQCKLQSLPETTDNDFRQKILSIVQKKKVTCVILNPKSLPLYPYYTVNLIVDGKDILDHLQSNIDGGEEFVLDDDHEEVNVPEVSTSPSSYDDTEAIQHNFEGDLKNVQSAIVEDVHNEYLDEIHDFISAQEASDTIDSLEAAEAKRIVPLPTVEDNFEDSKAVEISDTILSKDLDENEFVSAHEGTDAVTIAKESFVETVEDLPSVEENHELISTKEASDIVRNPALAITEENTRQDKVKTVVQEPELSSNSEKECKDKQLEDVAEAMQGTIDAVEILEEKVETNHDLTLHETTNTLENIQLQPKEEYEDVTDTLISNIQQEFEESSLLENPGISKQEEMEASQGFDTEPEHFVDCVDEDFTCQSDLKESTIINSQLDSGDVEVDENSKDNHMTMQLSSKSDSTKLDEEILCISGTKLDKDRESVTNTSEASVEKIVSSSKSLLCSGENIVSVLGIEIRDNGIFLAVVCKDMESELRTLKEEIQKLGNMKTEEESEKVVCGPCIVLMKDTWHRGDVVEVNGEVAKVSLWDTYSEEDCVSSNCIRKLDEDFTRQPKYLVWCTIPLLTCFDSDAASNILQCFYGTDITIQVVDLIEPCPVQLSDGPICCFDAIQQLIEKNLVVFTVSSPSVISGNHLARISHIDEGPCLLIYFQLLDQSQNLQRLYKDMNKVYKDTLPSVSLEDAVSGGLYAIKNSGKWERCTVLKNESTSIIFSIDTGVCRQVEESSVHPLFYDFVLKPQFAYPCVISRLSNLLDDNLVDVVNCFKQTSETDEMVITLSGKDESGFYGVDLTISGLDIVEWLKTKQVNL